MKKQSHPGISSFLPRLIHSAALAMSRRSEVEMALLHVCRLKSLLYVLRAVFIQQSHPATETPRENTN